jgi:hypothetical protein
MATVKSIRDRKNAPTTVDTASAAMLVESLAVHVQALRERVQESDQVRLEALVAGLGPVLESVAHSDDPAEVAAPAMHARALLEMLEDALPGDSSAARQLVLQSIASMQALLGVAADQRAWQPEPEPRSDAAASLSDASGAAYRISVLVDMISQELCNAQVNDAAVAIDRSFTCLHAVEQDLELIASFVRSEEVRAVRGGQPATEVSHG